MRTNFILLILLVTLISFSNTKIKAIDFSGSIGGELRYFPENNLFTDQEDYDLSLIFEPEFYKDLAGGNQRIVFEPFLRLNYKDQSRSHFDIRELYWQLVKDQWELSIGVRHIYWGVTESQHLVDIINQTDLVESPDLEDKLGQPMIQFTLIKNYGVFDFYYMPYFRKRTFPGTDGRLRPGLPISKDVQYEATNNEWHSDFAVRWSHTVSYVDIGLAHFSGTSREPQFALGLNTDLNPILIPRYNQLNQTSLDLQFTYEGWLGKLEVISAEILSDRYTAMVGGFEYTFVGILKSFYDLGLLAEYHYDDRKDLSPNPFEDDLFLGARLALNDIQSTDLLGGAVIDRDDGSLALFLEGSRRLGESYKLNIDYRGFIIDASSDPLYGFRNDDHFSISLYRYF